MQSLDALLAQGVVGRRILVRSDLNVPLDGGQITDDGRIRASLPTITTLADAGARVIVAAHLGRPKGEQRPELSLAPVAARLGELLDRPTHFVTASTGPAAASAVEGLPDGEVVVLENVRFDARETSKDDIERGDLADEYAQLCDVFVSDGFGVVHRKQASVYDIAMRRPAYAGNLVAAEMSVLTRLTQDPKRPYVVVLGGSKVSDKLGVIGHLLERVDRMLIGGGMVFTFLAAQGHGTGASLLEQDQVETVRGLFAEAEQRGVELVLPSDIVVADRFAADADARVVPADAIPDGQMGLDIGPDSAELFASRLADAATVFWNGPMGVFEFPAFAAGTRALAQALVDCPGFTVVGGGDSAAAVRTLGFADDAFGHISTGGGASLEYLEGRDLPGITVLDASTNGAP
ncbi:MAG TPA: phosphoglycerate kinase [Actinomycetes bacterium]|nr:phosphoglycerate kinase [Actinomycetes bacterium]